MPDTKTIYHYTPFEGFKAIIETRRLWASDVRYLNDYMEVKSGQQWLNTLSEIFFSDNGNFPHNEKVKNLIDELSDREITCFATCFCDKPDQLSQWRGYSGMGPGISLGFKSDVLEKSTPLSLMSVYYDQDDTIRALENTLKRAKAKLSSAPTEKEIDNILSETEEAIVSRIVTSKSHSFVEERECRLIARVTDSGIPNVKYRTKGALLVPFVEVDLASNWPKIINEVWIGPVTYREDTWKSVREFMDYNGLRNVKLMSSASPYRT